MFHKHLTSLSPFDNDRFLIPVLLDFSSIFNFNLSEVFFPQNFVPLVTMADKYEEYDYEEVQGRAGRKGRTKTEV